MIIVGPPMCGGRLRLRRGRALGRIGVVLFLQRSDSGCRSRALSLSLWWRVAYFCSWYLTDRRVALCAVVVGCRRPHHPRPFSVFFLHWHVLIPWWISKPFISFVSAPLFERYFSVGFRSDVTFVFQSHLQPVWCFVFLLALQVRALIFVGDHPNLIGVIRTKWKI